MINLIKRQFKYNYLENNKSILTYLLILILFLTFGPKNDKYINIKGMVFFVTLVTSFTLTDEQSSKFNILLNSLPINKYQVVLVNYLFIFINFIIVVVFIGIYSFLIDKLNLSPNIYYLDLDQLKVALGLIIMCLSVALPIIHLSIGCLSIFFIFISFGFISRAVSSNLNVLESMINNNKSTTFLLIALIIMLISIGISIFFYTNREFEEMK